MSIKSHHIINKDRVDSDENEKREESKTEIEYNETT